MKNFSRDRRSGGGNRDDKFNRRDGGRRDFRGDRDGGRPTMYPAMCAECGSPCEVPFRPSAGKPVFCKSCFGNKGGRKNRSDSAPAKQGPDQFAALHAKLDKIISTLALAKEQSSAAPATTPVKAKMKAKTKKKAK